MNVSIIIVNYNTKELIKSCLNSIYEKTKDISFEIIVVDNASQDGSQEMIRSEFKDVILIESSENLGFGKANNLGFEIVRGKYIFLLNSDTLLINNACKLFFDWMKKNDDGKIGAIGSYLEDAEGEIIHSYGKFPNLFILLKREIGILMKKNKKRIVNKEKYELSEKNVDYITGADLFFSREILEQIGVFDDKFFLYFEETDLQLRMKKIGLIRRVITGPRIIHLEGQSSKISNAKRIIFDKGMFTYLKKNRSALEVSFFKILYFLIKLIYIISADYTFDENKEYLKSIIKQ